MTPSVTLMLVLVAAYLLGSIPSSYVIVRLVSGKTSAASAAATPAR